MLLGCFVSVLLGAFPLIVQQRPAPTIPISTEKHLLVLYYTPSCPHSRKVLSYLENVHRQIPMKNVEEVAAKAELRSLGGKMLVPCLTVDGQPIYDANAIIHWLSQHLDELDVSEN